MPRMYHGTGAPSISVKWTKLDRTDACKVTEQPIHSSAFACLFYSSLVTTASETGDAKDVSWDWGKQQYCQSQSMEQIEQDGCKVTEQPIDGSAFACLFSSSLGTTALETRDDKDVSWVWGMQQPSPVLQ